MWARILSLPFIVLLMAVGAIAMYLPAIHAAVGRDFHVMRVFFQSANLLLILTAMIGLATADRVIAHQRRSYLLALLAAFGLLPIMLAVPFALAVPDTTFLNAYVEMVSCLTTTGATLFDDPDRLPAAVHLWRAIVGWLGGLLMLVAAVAILAPMQLGGFEVLAGVQARSGGTRGGEGTWFSDGSLRLQRYIVHIAPIYSAITLALWIVLLMLGDVPLVAASHAMSVVATSGISPVGGLGTGGSGLWGEAAIFAVMFLAVSRQTFGPDQVGVGLSQIWADPEFRLALIFVLTVPSFLIARHWLGAIDVESTSNLTGALRAFWGGVFTVMSFLTTTGFESSTWGEARDWSGLHTPGIILMGLALIGGGVATTAGGVKLLRVYALFRHGMREMDRLVHPSSVGGAGTVARRLRRRGAMLAWVFFMLFAMSLAVFVTGFALAGLDFEAAVTLAVAALSTTGPLVTIAAEAPIDLENLSLGGKALFATAMVMGRLEMLAIVALFNPEFWRR